MIAFRSAEEYRPFAPDGASGYYLRYEADRRASSSPARSRPAQRGLLAHELAHHFLSGVFRRQPRWFAEGVAVYMESLGEDAPGRRAPASARRRRRGSSARAGAGCRSATLLAWDGRAGGRGRARPLRRELAARPTGSSTVRADAFAELQRRLAAGEAPDDAWRAALPDHDPARPAALEALDAALAAYARGPARLGRRELAVPAAVGYFEQARPRRRRSTPSGSRSGATGPRSRRALLEAEVEEALEEEPRPPGRAPGTGRRWRAATPVPLARRAAAAPPATIRAP